VTKSPFTGRCVSALQHEFCNNSNNFITAYKIDTGVNNFVIIKIVFGAPAREASALRAWLGRAISGMKQN
jgi:hypothetical protein